LWKSDDKILVIWGSKHLSLSISSILDTALKGRLVGQSKKLRQFSGEICNQIGEEFNNTFADDLSAIPGLIVRRKVKSVRSGASKIAPPGDIDVLVAVSEKREIYVLECKSFAFARNPYEMQCELEKLRDTDPEKSPHARHQRRVKWAVDNLSAILQWLGIGDCKGWKVRSAFVVDQDLMAQHFQLLETKTISSSEFVKEIAASATKKRAKPHRSN
jgi:hypothetical protein